MPTLKIRFPGGRYHATPWGHHVNEGLIEWPPSPWRLLRALLACGFSSQGWMETPPVAQQLLSKLADILPYYQLPEATVAHSRHYMPYIEGKTQKTTLVFDTWANVGDRELFVHWPCELTDEERTLLRQLVSALGYLGRSESWVEAELIGGQPMEWNAVPCHVDEHRSYEWEQVSLMAAIPVNEYELWRSEQVQEVEEPLEGKKKTAAMKKKIVKALEPYPATVLDCLMLDTAKWKQHGWSQPPGSQRVLYWRRSDALQIGAPQRPKSPHYTTVTTMLLALTTPSGNRSALPPTTRALPLAERIHKQLVGKAARGQPCDCPVLTGKDEQGRPLRNHHEHAHVIPLNLVKPEDCRIDHILVFAKMGLRDDAQRAIRLLKRTWVKGGVGEYQIAVVGSGDLDMLRHLPPPLKRQVEELLGPADGSRAWKSTTPFVFPRFLKPRGRNTLLGQVNAELSSRRLPEAVNVRVDPALTRKLRHHVRHRHHGGRPAPVNEGYGLQLLFAEPFALPAPLSLGYAAHYGLGLFVAADESGLG